MTTEIRPNRCRNRLRDEGQAYPKSGCEVCRTGGMTGCPYEKETVAIENPAGKVAGYTPQPDAKVALVNSFKEDEERLLRRLDRLAAPRTLSPGEWVDVETLQLPEADQRWLAIGRTQLQEAFMSINRAVFQPTRIKLPEDDSR